MNNRNIYLIEDVQHQAVEKIKELSAKLEEELDKDQSEIDKKKVFDLMNQQFFQGLKLNTGIRH